MGGLPVGAWRGCPPRVARTRSISVWASVRLVFPCEGERQFGVCLRAQEDIVGAGVVSVAHQRLALVELLMGQFEMQRGLRYPLRPHLLGATDRGSRRCLTLMRRRCSSASCGPYASQNECPLKTFHVHSPCAVRARCSPVMSRQLRRGYEH